MRRISMLVVGSVFVALLLWPAGAFAAWHPGPGADCAWCHASEGAKWSSPTDLHHASAADVLTNVEHNSSELVVDECLNCHSMFQRPMGIASFVTPVDTTGNPAGTWTLLQPAASSSWQSTKCEVCHDPTSSAPDKLAKYGAWLDGTFSPSYIALQSGLPTVSVHVFGPTGYAGSDYADQASLSTQAARLCDSCHDPEDQGGDPNVVKGANDYGPQGGDSRAFVTSSHARFACIDCHPDHTFAPIADPRTVASCNGAGCHAASGPLVIGGVNDPLVVHTNHVPAVDTRISLRTSAGLVRTNRYVTLSSVLSGGFPAGATVRFQVRRSGTSRWQTVATPVVSAAGASHARYRATRTGRYAFRVVWGGAPSANASVSTNRWVRVY